MSDAVSKLDITMVGAGIFGLWQAFELTRRGHAVTLREASEESAVGAASRYAGAMLAPFCEAESAEPVIRDLGALSDHERRDIGLPEPARYMDWRALMEKM